MWSVTAGQPRPRDAWEGVTIPIEDYIDRRPGETSFSRNLLQQAGLVAAGLSRGYSEACRRWFGGIQRRSRLIG